MEATCKKKFEKDVYKSVFSVFLLSCSPKHLTDKLFKDLGYCSFYSCWSCSVILFQAVYVIVSHLSDSFFSLNSLQKYTKSRLL